MYVPNNTFGVDEIRGASIDKSHHTLRDIVGLVRFLVTAIAEKVILSVEPTQ